MSTDRFKLTLSFPEFIALMATIISMTALSTDAMLPALPEIGRDLGVVRVNDNQLIVSFLFAGLAVGQIFYGPLSDSIGRKPAIYMGFGFYIVGCLLSIFSVTFPVMLAGRTLQGVGVAGPRSVTMALIRDQFEGRAMARVMSFVNVVFILVPTVAPSLGQGILLFANWRFIFGAFLVLATIAVTWFAIRQPETLPPDRRRRFSLGTIIQALREVIGNRFAFGYTITAGLIFGAFLGYLNSAQQIFQVQYGLGTRFPLFFAVLALSVGSASFLNSWLVMRYGMRLLSTGALLVISGLAILFGLIAFTLGGHPPLWAVMAYLMISFFCIGILFGNLNALAMEPLGHIAGVGAAVVASLSTFISVPLGILIGQSYNGTILPLVGGFAILGVSATLVVRWVEQRKRVPGFC